ncbi:MAG TPA: glucans biosynthesis glucosyltransferase MdoH [Caulobacteraceae bacterium]|nr:glucans biosynthesis glucosyltransferase MdoH [Caulobacteraceae bacterium]
MKFAYSGPGSHPCADLPPEAPLAMPVQSLWETPAAGTRSPRGYRALGLIGVSLALTGLATSAFYGVLAADTLGGLDVLILAVFAPLFAWTSFSFASAAAGLWALARRWDPLGIDPRDPLPALASRTAILAPIYNEAPGPLCARLWAMWRSLQATGLAAHFDIFVLSDSTDDEIQREEHRQVQALRRRLGAGAPLYYRHRRPNTDRKAGNMADWIRRFGGAYDFMVVLDADSLMEGDTLARLAGAMERFPTVGLIQTTPVVINRHSLFGRLEQFASRMYGPLLARGAAWWSGSEGNYWGHNAILRVKAMAASAGLPHLPGRKPFGGDILSHDFVEAALLRRAGWEVRMAPTLGGSYEESPPTLADTIARDRRWCQGNLQHLGVLRARGLAWVSRLHLFRGVAAYLTAPLWLALLVLSALLPLKPEWGVSDAVLADEMAAARPHALASIGLVFAISIAFLIAPKLMALGAVLGSREQRQAFGGARRAILSVAFEIVLSALIAPVLMLNQLWALISILAGRDAGWNAQTREEGRVCFEEIANRHLGDTAVGVFLGLATWSAAPSIFLRMLPVIAGLVGCIPLAGLTATRALGEAARRADLLVIPEEVTPPPVVAMFNRLASGWPHEILPSAAEAESPAPARPATLSAALGFELDEVA